MRRHILTGQCTFHYVTFSCHGRRNLLVTPQTRQIVISVLDGLTQMGRARVSGFVIMPDHVHAVLWFDDDTALPKVMQAWKGLSAKNLRTYYEEHRPDLIDFLKTNRSGREVVSFWERRYYDFNVTSPEKLHQKLDYLHYNPVKKGLAAAPEEYIWSSAAWYAKQRSVGVRIEPGF
jgi:putative transposase